MTKEEHINYWLSSAVKDEDMMQYLFEGKRYVQALFFGHLYLEKVCKSVWVATNLGNVPPKTHNLLKLISEGNIKLSVADQAFLLKLNQYQIESRYPENIERLYSITDERLVKDYFKHINEIDKCIRENLP
jgi:HEPN domain-containing protein